jgi:hypothetical protein
VYKLLACVPLSNNLVVMSSKSSVVLSSNCSKVSRVNPSSIKTILVLTPVKVGSSDCVTIALKLPITSMLVVIIVSLELKLPSLSTALIKKLPVLAGTETDVYMKNLQHQKVVQ